jgi:ABC-2 type transport system ATP-binding protein
MDPVVRVLGASKKYGRRLALDDVSLDLHAGRTVGLIGANGAGKTTLVRAIVGLLRLDKGSVSRAAIAAPPAGLSYLPEERGLYPRHSPVRTLRYLQELRGMGPVAATAAAREALSSVAVDAADTRPLEQFSKGQQQKVQLAAAFAGAPACIVLDEPFSGLDPLNVRVVRDLSRAARERGAAILLSAHQLPLVMETCDDIVMLAGGRVVLAGAAPDVAGSAQELEETFAVRAVQGGVR